MHSLNLIMLAYLSMTSAAPAPVPGELIKEALSYKSFNNFLPSCDNVEDDPSYFPPYNGSYHIDDGHKLPKNGKDDECTKGHGDNHCWTEFWIVEGAIEYQNWVNTGSAIDCKSTSLCSSTTVDVGNQTCSSTGSSNSNGVGVDIGVAFSKAKFVGDAEFSASSSVSYDHTWVTSTEEQFCTSTGATNMCTWNDQNCHQVWYAQRDIRLYGYFTRVCNGKTSNVVQQVDQPKNKKGKVVRGMWDFNFILPINKLVGCNALCSAIDYATPTPPSEPKMPFNIDGWTS
ncbi:hypothetical protein F5Y12DRAFT_734454 [Xylaria sp. FL1777]|nr:hypothetical protein F5Y12DRAFT_734454 [Xylaria sp. FL1777]